MGVVVRFEPKKDREDSELLEQELAVLYDQSITSSPEACEEAEPQTDTKDAAIRFGPAIMIIIVSVIALLLVAFHLSGDHESSASANRLPSAFRIAD